MKLIDLKQKIEVKIDGELVRLKRGVQRVEDNVASHWLVKAMSRTVDNLEEEAEKLLGLKDGEDEQDETKPDVGEESPSADETAPPSDEPKQPEPKDAPKASEAKKGSTLSLKKGK